MIACVDGVTICVNRGNEGEVVDSHTCQCVQLLDSLIYTVEVRCSLLNLTIDILLVGELVLAGRAGREQTIDGLEDVIQRTADNGVGAVLGRLKVESQLVLLTCQSREDTTTMHGVLRVFCRCGVKGQAVLLGSDELLEHIICGKVGQLGNQQCCDA